MTPPPPPPPSPLLLIHPRSRYIRGFKFCTHCRKWVARGEEMYFGNNSKRPMCPECRQALKTQPRGDKAKERVAMVTTAKTLVR